MNKLINNANKYMDNLFATQTYPAVVSLLFGESNEAFDLFGYYDCDAFATTYLERTMYGLQKQGRTFSPIMSICGKSYIQYNTLRWAVFTHDNSQRVFLFKTRKAARKFKKAEPYASTPRKVYLDLYE